MMDIDKDRGSYNFDLNVQLETKIDSYEQDRKSYWENLGGWSAIQYELAERFAQAVLKNSEQLMPVQEIDGDLSKLQYEIDNLKNLPKIEQKLNDIVNLNIPWEQKREMIIEFSKECPKEPEDEESPLKMVWERFVIDMSWDAIEKIKGGASRIFQLYNLVLRYAPSKSTQQFLNRLSRCYIWGFDPECVILCRAVIDTAFNDRIPIDICEKHFGKPRRNYDFGLNDRIQAALNEKIIDEEIAKKARTIKYRGDKAVHYQPDVTRDVWGTICDTVSVLERIIQLK
jgi:hypothetical protein